MAQALLMTIMGMGMVFFVLVLNYFLIKLLGRLKDKKPGRANLPASPTAESTSPSAEEPDDQGTVSAEAEPVGPQPGQDRKGDATVPQLVDEGPSAEMLCAVMSAVRAYESEQNLSVDVNPK